MIVTRQVRHLRSTIFNQTIAVEKAYFDEPADARTWDEGVIMMVREFGLNENAVRQMLSRTFPDIYPSVERPT